MRREPSPPPPPPAAAPTLEPRLASLVWPASEASFLRRHWQRRPYCHRPDVDRLSALRAAWGGFTVRELLARRKGPITATTRPVGEPQQNWAVAGVDDALRRHDAGDTLVFDLDAAHPDVAPWYDGFTGWSAPRPNLSLATVICSPDGHGSSMHFDRNDVFNLQLSGTKTWRIAPNPGLVDPMHTFQVGSPLPVELRTYWRGEAGAPPDAAATETVVMTPGSVTYLPRGAWHETVAPASGEPCIGVSFIVAVTPYMDLVTVALRALMVADVEWRRSANAHWHRPAPADRDRLAALLAGLPALARRLAPADVAPPPTGVRLTDADRLRRSALAHAGVESVDGTPRLVARRIDQPSALHLDPGERELVEWLGARRRPFTVAAALRRFDAAYDPDSLRHTLALLVETGYLTLARTP